MKLKYFNRKIRELSNHHSDYQNGETEGLDVNSTDEEIIDDTTMVNN